MDFTINRENKIKDCGRVYFQDGPTGEHALLYLFILDHFICLSTFYQQDQRTINIIVKRFKLRYSPVGKSMQPLRHTFVGEDNFDIDK